MIQTKFRCYKKAYANTDSTATTWYYPICTLPQTSTSNYSSIIISGRIGGWVSSQVSYINAIAYNRGGAGISVLNIAGSATDMSSIYNLCDLVMYTDDDTGVCTLYAKCYGYFAFDLDIKLFQEGADIVFDKSTYLTETPSGTLGAQASTTTSRVEIINGTTLVNGDQLATNAIATTSANGLMSYTDKSKLDGIATGATKNSASSTTPKEAGTAAVGSESSFARGDHVHPAQTEITGNSGTATKLKNARTINLSGDVSGSASFDGSQDITLNCTVVSTGEEDGIETVVVTTTSEIEDNTNYTIPLTYVVGNNSLEIYYMGEKLIKNTHYKEIGTIGEESDIIMFYNWGINVPVDRTIEFLVYSSDVGSLTIDADELKSAIKEEVLDEIGDKVGIPTESIIAFEGDDIPEGFEEVESYDNYSTEEYFTGKYWTDNKKIYGKVLNLGALPDSASEQEYNWNIENINEIINYDIKAILTSNGAKLSLPYVYPGTPQIQYWITVELMTTSSVSIVTGMDRSNYNLRIILEYTKTTD